MGSFGESDVAHWPLVNNLVHPLGFLFSTPRLGVEEVSESLKNAIDFYIEDRWWQILSYVRLCIAHSKNNDIFKLTNSVLWVFVISCLKHWKENIYIFNFWCQNFWISWNYGLIWTINLFSTSPAELTTMAIYWTWPDHCLSESGGSPLCITAPPNLNDLFVTPAP